MTRIVAGSVGGRTLEVPPRGTRPTSDRVREAIFSRLEHYDVLDGARVLDLYAGSGALGLEAASRGAVEVVLVEAAASAAQVCARNAATLGLTGVQVVTDKAERFVRGDRDRAWDLVFLDPPYDVTDADVATVLAGLETQVSPEAVVVVERASRSGAPAWPATWRLITAKTYGDTTVYYAEPDREAEGVTEA
ncbi:16S rRNA (guanine(966)-N(2))-methyltransferase RsmD [Sanguibacter suarezii]|uniref:16S rRNA (guanine(966)-N(2))-methyltransferase RsmD n=1 Tax=Sanguibacter suarezii TaxID=60921 RepID=UPI00083499F7|nr:16S rRNA (guanine(966)-N(2))-methyltransferase RsmD [Sanguibacter suarezii]